MPSRKVQITADILVYRQPFPPWLSELCACADERVSGYPVPDVHPLTGVKDPCRFRVDVSPSQFAIFVDDHDHLRASDEDALDCVAVEQLVEFLEGEASAVSGSMFSMISPFDL